MSTAGVDGEFLEIDIRPPEQIAFRILILAAVVQRVMIEHDFIAAETPDQDIDENLFDLRASLAVAGAEQELTASERALLGSPAGEIDEDELYDSGWEIEALSAILATLGLTEALPAPPLLSDVKAIDAVLAGLDSRVASIAAALRLPDDESVARSREVAELWLWRASAEREIRESSGRERKRVKAELREVAIQAKAAGLIETTAAGNFETGGQSMEDWPDDELAGFELASIARLHAMNWLCGFGETWSDTPIEV